MATAAFDTLQAARAIEAAGLERASAEAIAQAIHQRSMDYATKADIGTLKAEIAAKIEPAKNAIMGAVLGVGGGMIVALIGGIVAVIATA